MGLSYIFLSTQIYIFSVYLHFFIIKNLKEKKKGILKNSLKKGTDESI